MTNTRIPTGLVLYQGKSLLKGGGDIVAIATLQSKNRKTGPMVQVWILRADMDPLETARADNRKPICGSCPLADACYVIECLAPLQVWRAWEAGIYPAYSYRHHSSLLRGRSVRWGAGGDPAALPVQLIRKITALCGSHAGYSHQLLDGSVSRSRADKLANYLMASVESPSTIKQAEGRGYRWFAAIPEGVAPPRNAIECLAASRGKQCINCRLCNGGSGRNVFITGHGRSAGRLAPMWRNEP